MSLLSILNKDIGIEVSRTVETPWLGYAEPFYMENDMALQAKGLTRGLSKEAASKSLFKWMTANFDYDANEGNYRNAQQVFSDMQGVCASLTFLYLAMIRSVNIPASFARVYRDERGNPVEHGCICLQLERNILADLVIASYDCSHKEYEVFSDAQTTRLYDAWKRVPLQQEKSHM